VRLTKVRSSQHASFRHICPVSRRQTLFALAQDRFRKGRGPKTRSIEVGCVLHCTMHSNILGAPLRLSNPDMRLPMMHLTGSFPIPRLCSETAFHLKHHMCAADQALEKLTLEILERSVDDNPAGLTMDKISHKLSMIRHEHIDNVNSTV
jgi:hypothetical protein